MLLFSIAFALMKARKLVRASHQGLTEGVRYRVVDEVRRLQEHGGAWDLSNVRTIAKVKCGYIDR